jgi:hypothetical protein
LFGIVNLKSKFGFFNFKIPRNSHRPLWSLTLTFPLSSPQPFGINVKNSFSETNNRK